MLEKIKCYVDRVQNRAPTAQNDFHEMREHMQVQKQEVWRNELQLQVREKKMKHHRKAIASAKGVPDSPEGKKSFYYKLSKIKNKQKNK